MSHEKADIVTLKQQRVTRKPKRVGDDTSGFATIMVAVPYLIL